MSRPRKPTKLHELSGAFAKNPQRRAARVGEPLITGELGGVPADLPEDVAACWREIVAQAVPGVLTRADRVIVECAARLLAHMRVGRVGGITQLKACMQQLGMTPAARSLVSVADAKDSNEFAGV